MLDASRRRILESLADDALVLDVGAGGSPFERADWVLDILPFEERGIYAYDAITASERFTRDTWMQRDMCDHEPWPFEDGQFDFAVFLMSVAELKSVAPYVVMSDGTRVIGREGLSNLLRQIFTPAPARDAIFPLDDEDLALALRGFEHSVIERGNVYFGWYGETDAFIEEHLPKPTGSA